MTATRAVVRTLPATAALTPTPPATGSSPRRDS